MDRSRYFTVAVLTSLSVAISLWIVPAQSSLQRDAMIAQHLDRTQM